MSDQQSGDDSGGVMAEGEEEFDEEHQRIVVDFDKTLTESEESYITGTAEAPDEEMVEWVNYRDQQLFP